MKEINKSSVHLSNHKCYLLSKLELVALLRRFFIVYPEEYVHIHADNPDPKYTGGIIHEGLKASGCSSNENVDDFIFMAQQGHNLVNLKLSTIRYVECGYRRYYNEAHSSVVKMQLGKYDVSLFSLAPWMDYLPEVLQDPKEKESIAKRLMKKVKKIKNTALKGDIVDYCPSSISPPL